MSKRDNRILNLVIKELRTNYQNYFSLHEKPQLIPISYLETTNSFIWKCALEGNSTGRGVYIKLHKKKSYTDEEILHFCKTEYEVLKSLFAAFEQYPLYSVVKPVACFPEYSIIITEDAEGEKLSDQIKHKTRHFSPDQKNFIELTKYCFSAGEWLRLFQSVTKTNRRITLRECGLMESILKALQHWNELGINSGIQYHIIQYVEQQLSKLGNETIEISGQHGHFVPFNIIVNHDRIIVFDFPRYKNGATYYDVARFCSALLTYPKNPLYNSQKTDQLVNLFIEGYSKETTFSYEIFNLFLIYYMVADSLRRETSLTGKTLFQKCYRRRVISFYSQWFSEIATPAARLMRISPVNPHCCNNLNRAD